MFITFVAIAIIVGWITEEPVADFMNFLPKCLNMHLLFFFFQKGGAFYKNRMPPWIKKLLVPVSKDGHEFISRTQGSVQIRKLINLISEKRQSHIYQQVLQMHLTKIPCNFWDKFSKKNRNADSIKDNLPTQIM